MIGDEIGLLIELQNISITNAKLNSLPQSFSELSNLNFINFLSNNFTKFPSVLYSCSSLKQIDFTNNLISSFDNGINQMTNLEILILQNNKITELPIGLSMCPKLKLVDVRMNTVSINGKESKNVKSKLGKKYLE